MLVLSRSVGEQIAIDASICVTVVSIRGNKVRLGVTAPESVRVDRAEIHERRAGPVSSSPGLLIPPSSQEEIV
jgi:carbon storage regulator